MIRRISKKNDLRDLIKSCPSGVIDDIYAIDYYIQGYNETIQGTFEKKGDILEVILPSTDLETLPNGILMRRAYYKVLDSSYPDGYYNLEFEDNMNVWLGESDSEPGPSPEPGEYVTEEELAETLGDYATKEYVDEAISDIPSPENVVQYDLDHPLIEDFGLNVDVLQRSVFDHGTDVLTKGLVLSYQEQKVEDVVKVINTIELRSNQLWKVNYDKTIDYHETRDPYVLQSNLSSYATQNWVGQQGYITSAALSGYATQQWVDQQDFASDSDLDSLESRVSILEHGGSPVTLAWGGISGTVTDQTDLVNYIGSRGYITSSALSGYATQQWVNSQIDGLASEDWVFDQALTGYATQDWVGEQGYITSASLSGYATQNWVQNNYGTRNWTRTNFVEKSEVWTGTESEWNQLTAEEQASYTIALVTE